MKTIKEDLEKVSERYAARKIYSKLNIQEDKMAKLIEEAQAYTPKTTKNISELPEVSVNMNLEDDEFEFTDEKGEAKKVEQKVIVVEGEKYRVPVSVIQQLQVIIEDNPNLKKFKVKKTGEGKENTRYTVIPLG